MYTCSKDVPGVRPSPDHDDADFQIRGHGRKLTAAVRARLLLTTIFLIYRQPQKKVFQVPKTVC